MGPMESISSKESGSLYLLNTMILTSIYGTDKRKPLVCLNYNSIARRHVCFFLFSIKKIAIFFNNACLLIWNSRGNEFVRVRHCSLEIVGILVKLWYTSPAFVFFWTKYIERTMSHADKVKWLEIRSREYENIERLCRSSMSKYILIILPSFSSRIFSMAKKNLIYRHAVTSN